MPEDWSLHHHVTSKPTSKKAHVSERKGVPPPKQRFNLQSHQRLVANTPSIYTYTSMNCKMCITRNVRFPKFIDLTQNLHSPFPILYRSVPLGLWFTSLPASLVRETKGNPDIQQQLELNRNYLGTAFPCGSRSHSPVRARRDDDRRAALHFASEEFKSQPFEHSPQRGTV